VGLRGTPGGSDMEGGGSPPTSPVKLPFESVTNIALDWDDTLLPTTQLTDNFGDYITGGAALPPRIVAELSHLQDDAVRFLDEVALCGGATVITNAMQGAHAQLHCGKPHFPFWGRRVQCLFCFQTALPPRPAAHP
jgi:hypothetical protein